MVVFSGCFVTPVAVAPPPGRAAPPAVRPKTVLVEREPVAPALTDGLEANAGWKAADLLQWKDANPSEARYVDHAETGKLLLIRWKGEGKNKAAVVRTADLKLPASGLLRFRTYSYADQPIKLAVGFFVGEARAYYETPTVDVPPKTWVDHSYDLRMSYFKCAASQWKHAARLGQPDEVKELVVLVYDAGSGSLYVDALVVAGQ